MAKKEKRNVKRTRYTKSFEQRYGMTRAEWRAFKKNNPPAVVHAKREAALLR